VSDALKIEVVYCPEPGTCDLVLLTLPTGATLADAVRASGLIERHGLPAQSLRLGVWCKPREADTVLRQRDRVEIYRPLKVDPKEARRQRYQQHKERLAARPKRPGPG
jgi:putative ubiquitin-RnfH superfamily antitoxin RatB of RatAB toxin-antitoxin module